MYAVYKRSLSDKSQMPVAVSGLFLWSHIWAITRLAGLPNNYTNL